MEHDSLNDLYALYIKGQIKREELEGSMYQKLINGRNKYNYGHLKREEYNDYVSWCYSRLHNAIDLYRESSSSFEVYIGSLMRLSVKEYSRRIINRRVTEYAAWSVQVPDLYTHEENPVYLTEGTNEKNKNMVSQLSVEIIKRKKNPRQLLILILKCYYFISDDFLDRIAPLIGIEREELKKMIDKLRVIRSERENEFFYMKERIHCQFYRCIVYEKKLSLITENQIVIDTFKLKLERARKRLENMRKRLAKIRLDPSNRQIAELIGISKGAVDSTLYTLRKKQDTKPN
jgi:biotin operon repressor